MAEGSLVDTRVLGRPPKFGGEREQWQSWKFVFKAYVGALGGEILDEMTAAESRANAIALTALPEATKNRSRTLAYILAQTLTGAPLLMLMNTE